MRQIDLYWASYWTWVFCYFKLKAILMNAFFFHVELLAHQNTCSYFLLACLSFNQKFFFAIRSRLNYVPWQHASMELSWLRVNLKVSCGSLGSELPGRRVLKISPFVFLPWLGKSWGWVAFPRTAQPVHTCGSEKAGATGLFKYRFSCSQNSVPTRHTISPCLPPPCLGSRGEAPSASNGPEEKLWAAPGRSP